MTGYYETLKYYDGPADAEPANKQPHPFSGLLLRTSAYALAFDTVQRMNTQLESPVYISEGSGSTLLAERQPSPDKTPEGNAYAYGNEKDNPT